MGRQAEREIQVDNAFWMSNTRRSDKIIIPTGFLFPWHFLFMALVVFVVGITLIFARPVIGLLLVMIGLTILTGNSGVEVDKVGKMYREYWSFFGIKSGQWKRFHAIDKIFINRTRVTRTMYAPVSNHSASFSNHHYNAFLKFEDGRKLHLFSRSNKNRLLRKLAVVTHGHDVVLEDQSEPVA